MTVTEQALPPPDFDALVSGDKIALRIYLAVALVVALLGLGLLFTTFFMPIAEGGSQQDLIMRIVGMGITVMGALPVNQCVTRARRINGVRVIEKRWRQVVALEPPPEAEMKRLDELIGKLYEREATGE